MANNYFCNTCTERHCNGCQIDIINKNKRTQFCSEELYYRLVPVICGECGRIVRNISNKYLNEDKILLTCFGCGGPRLFHRTDLSSR